MRRSRGRGRRRGHAEHEEGNERWLLTYADMITLLMALFMILFSISSVNISKVQTLQQSLRAAFSGAVLPGGKAIAHPGASANATHTPSEIDLQAIVPVTSPKSNLLQSGTAKGTQSASSTSQSAAAQQAAAQQTAAQREVQEFARIKKRLDEYAGSHGFSSSVKTIIEPRGLVIRVLTDELLFASGQANLDPRAFGLLGEVSRLLNVDITHPIDVEGNTDNVPIHSGQFPSNWELSTARASTVLRFLAEHGVGPSRLTAVGYADERPLQSNETAAGRARNRRVEIVMKRIYGSEREP
jgi:chemotaxis protein MotB